MVKAAILYADEVTLYSPASSIYLTALQMRDLSRRDRVVLLSELGPILQPESAAELSLLAARYGEAPRSSRRKMDRMLDRRWKELSGRINEFLKEHRVDELVQAQRAGLLHVHEFAWGTETPPAFKLEPPRDDIADQYVDAVVGSLRDNATLPLLDANTNELVLAGLREGVFEVSRPAARKGNPVAFANWLFNQLPTFSSIPFDELIGLRDELSGPLVRFRRATSELFRLFDAAQWDEEFQLEASKLIIEKVDPAIAELEELAKSKRYVRLLADEVLGDRLALAGFLGLAYGAFSAVTALIEGRPPSPDEILPAGAANMAIPTAWRALKRREEIGDMMRHNDFFLYYGLRRLAATQDR